MVFLGGELARLADRGVDPRVLHDGGGVAEAAHVADLGHDLRAERVPDARYGEDERLDLLDARPYPGLDLGCLALYEVDLVYEQLDLEGEGRRRKADAARGLGDALYLVGLRAAELAMACPLEGLGQRVGPDGQALLGGRAPLEERLRALAEGVGEDGVVLGEHLVERHDDLALQVGHALLERLVQARELPQLDHRLVPQPARLEAAAAKRLRHEHAVDDVGLHARASLEAPHRIGPHGVYHDDGVARVLQPAEERQPVVAGRLHAHEQVGLRLGEPFQVGDAAVEPASGVCELHGLRRVAPVFVGRPYDVVVFGDVYPGVDHRPCLSVHGRPLLTKRARNLL